MDGLGEGVLERARVVHLEALQRYREARSELMRVIHGVEKSSDERVYPRAYAEEVASMEAVVDTEMDVRRAEKQVRESNAKQLEEAGAAYEAAIRSRDEEEILRARQELAAQDKKWRTGLETLRLAALRADCDSSVIAFRKALSRDVRDEGVLELGKEAVEAESRLQIQYKQISGQLTGELALELGKQEVDTKA